MVDQRSHSIYPRNHGTSTDHSFGRTPYGVLPKALEKIMSTWTHDCKNCAFPECNKKLPFAQRSIYCNSKCRSKHLLRIKLAKEGKTLTWRGVRRPGL